MDNILQGKEKPAAKRPRLDSNSEREYEEFIHDDTDYYRSHIRNMEANSSNAQKNKHLRDKPKPRPLHNEKGKYNNILWRSQNSYVTTNS